MQYDITENLPGILMIISQLRTAVIMGKGYYGIYTFQIGFSLQSGSQFFGNTVDTSYCRHDPYFITYTDLTIGSAVSHESTLFVRLIRH